MNIAEFYHRMEAIKYLRREVALAIISSEFAEGSQVYWHVVWHNFMPYFMNNYQTPFPVFLDDIAFLVDQMNLSEDYHWKILLRDELLLALRSLSIMDYNILYGCQKCY